MATGRSRDVSDRLGFHSKCTIKVIEKYEGKCTALRTFTAGSFDVFCITTTVTSIPCSVLKKRSSQYEKIFFISVV